MSVPTAAILIIGNEVLSGRVQDLNVNMMATRFVARGIRLAEVRIVPDIEKEIVDALNPLRARYTYVFTSGGIGPTHDDITVESVAKAFGVNVVEHAEARARLAAHYGEENLTPARLRMALVPEGAGIIDNPLSGAPGVRIENVFLMAGVPQIAEAMFEAVLPTLESSAPVHSISLHSTVYESLLADELREIAARFPDLDMGSYPSLKGGHPSLTLVVRGTDAARLSEAEQVLADLIRAHGQEPEIDRT